MNLRHVLRIYLSKYNSSFIVWNIWLMVAELLSLEQLLADWKSSQIQSTSKS